MRLDYQIDGEIVDLVMVLNQGGIETVASCSGHGKERGHIWLKDGRVLIIQENVTNTDEAKSALVDILNYHYIQRVAEKVGEWKYAARRKEMSAKKASCPCGVGGCVE